MWCRVDITKQHFVIVNGWTSSRCRARSTLQGNVSPDLCFARKSLMAADILNLTKFYGIRFTTKTQIKFITRTLLEKLKLQTFAQSWLYNKTCKSISRAEQRGRNWDCGGQGRDCGGGGTLRVDFEVVKSTREELRF